MIPALLSTSIPANKRTTKMAALPHHPLPHHPLPHHPLPHHMTAKLFLFSLFTTLSPIHKWFSSYTSNTLITEEGNAIFPKYLLFVLIILLLNNIKNNIDNWSQFSFWMPKLVVRQVKTMKQNVNTITVKFSS